MLCVMNKFTMDSYKRVKERLEKLALMISFRRERVATIGGLITRVEMGDISGVREYKKPASEILEILRGRYDAEKEAVTRFLTEESFLAKWLVENGQ